MVWFEEKLRPRGGAAGRVRDVLGLGLLVALAVALLPALRLDGGLLLSALGGGGGARQRLADEVTRHAGEMVAWYLLPALGFSLALRRGAVDLSVWAVAGLGGLVAAAALRAGWGPGWALAAALATGLAVGGLNGLLVAGVRVPSVLVTVGTGLGLLWACGACVGSGQRAVALPEGAFDAWRMTRSVADKHADDEAGGSVEALHEARPVMQDVWLPLRVTRMMVVGVIFSVAVLVLLVLMANDIGRPDDRVRGKLLSALSASGALAAVGGACWLMDQPQSAPVPTRLVDDLRIPVAALLAGALFLSRRRTAIIAMCLPLAILLVTAWRQEVWHLPAGGYALQVAVLGGMIVVAQISFAHVIGPRARPRWLASTAATMVVSGLLILAGGVYCDGYGRQRLLQRIGLGVWLGGAGLLIVSRLLSRRRQPLAGPANADPAPPERETTTGTNNKEKIKGNTPL